MGSVFVFVGAKVAPDRRENTLYVLTAIALVSAGFLLWSALQVLNYWAIWRWMCIAAGATLTAYSIHQGDTSIA